MDKRGHEWSPESYVMMDMRSTLGNTARAAQNMRCDEYGINLVEISSHLGARPLCAPYQGRIFSRDGSRGTTTDGNGNKIPYSPLSETSYGEAGELFGVNCGHVQYPFFPGCSFQSYFPYPEEENAERYKQFQKQRYMERKIRATKRECMMFNETGDTEAFKEASVRLKQQRKAYKDYSQSVGLKVHNDRTQVYGFDRSVSSKATWANRKAENAANNGGVAANVKVKNRGGSGSSGGHAVTVTPPKPDVMGNTDIIYKDTKTGLTSEGKGDIIKLGSGNVALENQRYGRNKNTLVNHAYIESGEYRRKFDKITDNPEANKSLYNSAKEALKHRSGTEFEDMYWIDGDTGKIIKSALDEKKPMGVAYSDSIKEAISGKDNLITLHTHPHSMPPSADDFNSNCSHKYVTGVVACHNGKVFVYSSSQIVEPKLCDLYIAQFISEGHTEYEAQIMALEKMKQSHNIDFWEVK